jgi:zinc protease
MTGAALVVALSSCTHAPTPATKAAPVTTTKNAMPEQSAPAVQEGTEPLRYRLDNGLTVIMLPSHGAPVVAFQAWIGVGSADETDDEAGMAHVFEHMLFKGTDRRGVGQIAQEIEAAGGDINAWTSFDQTVYHLVLASRYFDTGLDILADAVLHSSFDPGELERELKVVLEEIKQGEDSPARVVTQALFSTAFSKHPYRRPVIGFEKTVKKVKREKLLEFFHRWYVPNNITLVVVGDFDPAAAKKKIEQAWGSAKSVKIERATREEPEQQKPRATVVAQDVRETHVSFAFHIPGIRSEDTGALDVAAIILGQGDSSRLNLNIKRNKQLATDVFAYTYTPRDPGLFVVGAAMPGDPEKAERAIMRELFRLAHEDVSPDELAKARTIIESDAVYQKETVQGMARKLGFFQTVAGGTEYEAEYYRQVAAVTPEKIRQVAEKYLTTGNMTVAALVSKKDEAGAADLKKRAVAVAREEEKAAAERFAQVVVTPGDDQVVRKVLGNGVRILVKRDPSVKIVALRAVWVGGLRYEEAKTNGVNNLIATLITRGTTTRDSETIVKEVEGMAGSIGGFSGRNSFGLRSEMLSKNFDRGLEILADCILNPAFPDEEVEKEKRHVLDELHAQEDNLSSVTFRLFAETLYQKHPYRFDMLGSATSVAGLTPDVLRDYYARHMPLGDLTIAIVGDVEPAHAIEKAAALFGGENGVEKRAPAPPKVAREDLWARPKGTVEVFKFLSRQQSHMVVGFPGTTIDDPDRYALEVMATILSGQGGRLFVELRDKKGLAYRVNAFSLEGIDPGYFAVYIATSPANLTAALDGIKAELKKIAEEPVTDAELDRAKKYLVGAHEISLQRRAALASTLAFHESYGLGYDEYRRYSAGVLAVDAAAVQRVAKAYLDWDRAIVATTKPEELTPGADDRRKGVRKKPPAQESRPKRSGNR